MLEDAGQYPLLNDLEEGDLIEFPRNGGVYSHLAVYVGDGDVVHRAPIDDAGSLVMSGPQHLGSSLGIGYKKAIIRRDKFSKVVKTSEARKNNKKHGRTPLPKSEIVQRAVNRLGEIGYNVLVENCEHFATWCRYGEKKSTQSRNAVTGFFSTLATITVTVISVVVALVRRK